MILNKEFNLFLIIGDLGVKGILIDILIELD